MRIPQHLVKKFMAKYGSVLDLKHKPELLQEIVDEIEATAEAGGAGSQPAAGGPPFGISWMDSWVAHWTINEKIMSAEGRDHEFSAMLRALVDLKFNERLAEIKNFIRHYRPVSFRTAGRRPARTGAPDPSPVRFDEPPDGGPPEPGAPDPSPIRFEEPPDGGPPEPGTPPTGPDRMFPMDNPWILYWFVSVKAPLILEMIDAHMTRRMNDLKGQSGRY